MIRRTTAVAPAEQSLADVAAALEQAGFRPGFATPAPAHGPLAYGCHPLYYRIASRGKGAALTGHAATFALTVAPPAAELDTDRSVCCILRPEIHRPEDFWPALQSTAEQLGVAFLVKSIGLADAELAVKGYGVRGYRDKEYWSNPARFDDQSFPEVMLDLHRPGASAPVLESIRFEPCSPVAAGAISRRVASRWLDWYCDRHREYSRSELEDYYAFALSDSIVGQADDAFVAWRDQEPVAFALASHVSNIQADVWVVATAPEPARLGRRFFAHLRSVFTAKGLRYLGLGGSELRSLFHFKRRLGGRILTKRTHLLVGC